MEKKKKNQPRHILVTQKETARAAESGRGTGRGASPGPASSFFPPRPGRASPPRAAATKQPAGRAELSAARSRERKRELARSLQPAWAASGAVSQSRSWNLKRQARRGVWALAQERSPQEAHRLGTARDGRSGPCEKSFLRGRREERLRTRLSFLSRMQNTVCKERVRGIFFSSLGD